MPRHRVAITGLGLVTPLGIGKEQFWSALLERRVAVDRVTRFDTETFPTKIAAEISDFDPGVFLDRRRLMWTVRFSQLAVAGA
ncbi:MAG: beta-ketoacyl-[acyl-carrier-protein] synthase II, partial [Candidatus Eremiobacteraeota bacterium]|nr:beta-ketoacyl-[acyl-carrier-protein] synthase II [Candidatus Eremiobacteraeota bacterium]